MRDEALDDERSRILRRLGENIRKCRTVRGLTQRQLASMAGLDQSYISRVESGEKNLGMVYVVRIAGVLGATPNELLDYNVRRLMIKSQ